MLSSLELKNLNIVGFFEFPTEDRLVIYETGVLRFFTRNLIKESHALKLPFEKIRTSILTHAKAPRLVLEGSDHTIMGFEYHDASWHKAFLLKDMA